MTLLHGKNYGRPTLDLNFAENKSLIDTVTGRNLITFSRSQSGKEATYVGSDGLIKYATADTPRFDHDPTTGESLGLLIEESRTNYISNSTTLSPLTFNGGTGVAPQVGTVITVGPDGASASITRCQLDRGTGNTAADSSTVYFAPTTPSAFYSQSVWLKSNDANNYVIIMYDAGGAKGNEFTVTPQWQRFTLDSTTSYKNSNDKANTTPSFIIGLRNDPANINFFTGNTNSQTADILVWGPQIENGTFATSYIPTSGAQVIRDADEASITGTNFSSWYNQNSISLFAEVSYYAAAIQQTVTTIYDTLNTNKRQLLGSNELYFNIGDVNIQITPTAESQKFAYAAEPNNVSFYKNSLLQGSDSAFTLNTANSILIGKFTTNRYLNGTISRLTYWPKRLPDLELQQLTK